MGGEQAVILFDRIEQFIQDSSEHPRRPKLETHSTAVVTIQPRSLRPSTVGLAKDPKTIVEVITSERQPQKDSVKLRVWMKNVWREANWGRQGGELRARPPIRPRVFWRFGHV